MKNIKQDIGDSLRPEYQRSDFGEMVRGKYAKKQVDFAELVPLLLGCIGEDEGLTFMHYSPGKLAANRQPGEWTYEIDEADQITLRYWCTEDQSHKEVIVNPPHVTDSHGRSELQTLLQNHVRALKTRVETL